MDPPHVNEYGSKLSHNILSTFLHRNMIGFNYKIVNAINTHHVIVSNGWSRKGSNSGASSRHVIPPHGVFIDSCHSHCNTCYERAGADMSNIWVSKKIQSHQHKNPISAFSEWYSNTLLLQAEEEIGHAHNQQLFATFYRYQHDMMSRTYIQNKPFPCDECCDCN